jgi:hypothetical protein
MLLFCVLAMETGLNRFWGARYWSRCSTLHTAPVVQLATAPNPAEIKIVEEKRGKRKNL